MTYGAQLYTIREHMQTREDFRRSMKRIAEIGFTCVQMSGVSAEISAEEIAETCGENGLEIIITHTPPAKILERTADVIREHRLMGAKYVGIGMIPGDYNKDFARFLADFSPAAREINAAGLQFMYHNHEIEFERAHSGNREHVSAATRSLEAGRASPYLVMDFIFENFPEIGFTLDTYWVQAGGADSAAWIRKLAGRVDVLHLKDFAIIDGKAQMAEVFEGNMNWDAIFAAAKDSGVKYGMIEQDDCYGKCPFGCLELSLKNLNKWGK
ncbi:MAG: sugar phosphate isomerase/epimerase [Defluviitaleaceae bacterium]|nr:sugar phosphate isomerase/epimerase [Defluviitaleaceae bacterium]